MKHEINGLRVEISVNPFQFQEAIVKKLAASEGMSSRALRESFVQDLLDDRFLHVEMNFNLSKLNLNHYLDSDFKMVKEPTEEEPGAAAKVWKLKTRSCKESAKT